MPTVTSAASASGRSSTGTMPSSAWPDASRAGRIAAQTCAASTNTAPTKAKSSTMEGSAMRRLAVKNSASSQAQAARPATIGVDPVPASMMKPSAPRNSTMPMVTKMSAKPVTKRRVSSSRGSGIAGGPAPSPSIARRLAT